MFCERVDLKKTSNHNILELCKILAQAWFTPSKTKIDIWYETFVYEVPHELRNNLGLTKLENTTKIL